MQQKLYLGWHQVAFGRELKEELTPVEIASKQLILVREGKDITAYDAICPHRGAHLAFGGKLKNAAVICPFHGHHIQLACDGTGPFCVSSYQTLSVGGLVFVLLDPRHENGFTAWLKHLEQTHVFVQGFTLKVRVPAELVIENGFDRAHFEAVHGLRQRPDLRLLPSNNNELNVEGRLNALAFNNLWHCDPTGAANSDLSFSARVFSPNLCITRLGDSNQEYLVISGATPNSSGDSIIRVSIAARAENKQVPNEQAVRWLLRDSKLAYEQDIQIWEHRANEAPEHFSEEDDLVVRFHRFCQQFVGANG